MPVGELDHTLRPILPLVLPRVFNVLQAGPKKLRVRVELLRKQTVDKHLFKPGRGRKKKNIGHFSRPTVKKTGSIPRLPVSNSEITPIFEGHLLGVNLITGVAVSFPTLGNGNC